MNIWRLSPHILRTRCTFFSQYLSLNDRINTRFYIVSNCRAYMTNWHAKEFLCVCQNPEKECVSWEKTESHDARSRPHHSRCCVLTKRGTRRNEERERGCLNRLWKGAGVATTGIIYVFLYGKTLSNLQKAWFSYAFLTDKSSVCFW